MLKRCYNDGGRWRRCHAEIDFSKFGEIEIHPLSRIKKLSAINLARNWRIAPHVTQMADADITDMEEFPPFAGR